jgi:hypothetical protein
MAASRKRLATAARAATPRLPSKSFSKEAVVDPIVTINSSGTPSINGSWAVNLQQILFVVCQVSAINATGKFTDGTTSITWVDGVTGCSATFSTTGLFISWALAYAEFATQLTLAQFQRAAMPTSPVTIP